MRDTAENESSKVAPIAHDDPHATPGHAAAEEHAAPCASTRASELSDAVADRLARIARFANAPHYAFIVPKDEPMRLLSLRLVLDPAFDWLVLAVILLNAAFLCAYDPLDQDNSSFRA